MIKEIDHLAIPLHPVILNINTKFLDASNIVEIEEGFSRYLNQTKVPSRLPADFKKVTYISSVIGVIMTAIFSGSEHTLLMMNLDNQIRIILKLLEWDKLPQLEFIPIGCCPHCQTDQFDNDSYICDNCGQFECITFRNNNQRIVSAF